MLTVTTRRAGERVCSIEHSSPPDVKTVVLSMATVGKVMGWSGLSTAAKRSRLGAVAN